MLDTDRDPKVLARDARRYRGILRDLIIEVGHSAELAGSGSYLQQSEGVMRIRRALQRAERAGWPSGMAAKRKGR